MYPGTKSCAHSLHVVRGIWRPIPNLSAFLLTLDNGPSSVDFGHPLQTHELCPNGFASPPDEEVVYIYIIFLN